MGGQLHRNLQLVERSNKKLQLLRQPNKKALADH
jgi:hypothetical protein